jgi:serine/threonine protein kinase
MNEERWRRVWEIFQTAREMPAAEGRAYAESAITDSEALEEVLTLLANDEATDSDQPASILGPAPLNEQAALEEEWPHLGKTYGRFVITGPLGRGGTGEVYRARDAELNRTVALKFFGTGTIGSSGTVSRSLREAQAASALNHPGIVTVYDVLHTDSGVAIVMELIEGLPLRSICGNPHPVAEVANWGRQIAMALAAAHGAGIVHRDIKPENLILRPDGFVKVLDFGLARQVQGSLLNSTISQFAGTLSYMSPEQVHGERPGPSSDVFTLGIVLYELATGVHPFGSESAMKTKSGAPSDARPSLDPLLAPYAIATLEPVAASRVQPSILRSWTRSCRRCSRRSRRNARPPKPLLAACSPFSPFLVTPGWSWDCG